MEESKILWRMVIEGNFGTIDGELIFQSGDKTAWDGGVKTLCIGGDSFHKCI